MESLKKDKESDAAPSSSGIFVIELNTVSSIKTWVLDTGCGSHIRSDIQGLKKSRQLRRGEIDLRVGNGAKPAALAV